MAKNIKITNVNGTKTIKLLDKKITTPSLVIYKNGITSYGPLFANKPNYPTLSFKYQDKKYYLTDPVGLYTDPNETLPRFYMTVECSGKGENKASLRCMKVFDASGAEITKQCKHEFSQGHTHCNYAWYDPSKCTDGNYDTWYGRYRGGYRHTIFCRLTLTVTPPKGVLVGKIQCCFGPQVNWGTGGIVGWYDKKGKRTVVYTSSKTQYGTKAGAFYSGLPANKIVEHTFNTFM